MKIVCTGNPTVPGIAKSLAQLYPDIAFISRSNGYDFSQPESFDKFKNLLADYDVFINHSQLTGDAQRQLLTIAREVWTHGHVINIGSVLEFPMWEWIEPAAGEEKRKLRDLSLSLSSEHFKTTHLILGGLQSCNGDPLRIHTDNVANTIKWILEYDCHVPLLYVDRVSDELVKHYNSIKP